MGTAKHLHCRMQDLTPFSPTFLSDIKSTEDWDSSTQLEFKRAPPCLVFLLPFIPSV